jgi:hypothetical protein
MWSALAQCIENMANITITDEPVKSSNGQ